MPWNLIWFKSPVLSPLIDSFSGAVTFLTSTCLLKYGYWLLKVMSESLKRVEIFFSLTHWFWHEWWRRGDTKKVAFQLVYKYWSRLSLRPQKRVGKEITIAYCVLGGKTNQRHWTLCHFKTLIGSEISSNFIHFQLLISFISSAKVRGQQMGESYDFHVTMISGHI